MKYSLRCEHLTLSDLDTELLDKKIQRLQKHVAVPYVMDVGLIHSTHHNEGDVVECRLTIEQGKHVFHAERSGSSVQEALDDALHALRQELKKHHDKTVQGNQGA